MAITGAAFAVAACYARYPFAPPALSRLKDATRSTSMLRMTLFLAMTTMEGR